MFPDLSFFSVLEPQVASLPVDGVFRKSNKDFKYVSSVMFLESVTCYQSLVRVSQWQYDTGMEDQICIKVAVPAEKGTITAELLSISISFSFL